LRLNRRLLAIVKKCDSKRDDGYGRADADKDVGQDPHAKYLFTGEKRLSA
jgi:hypothetical protein